MLSLRLYQFIRPTRQGRAQHTGAPSCSGNDLQALRRRLAAHSGVLGGGGSSGRVSSAAADARPLTAADADKGALNMSALSRVTYLSSAQAEMLLDMALDFQHSVLSGNEDGGGARALLRRALVACGGQFPPMEGAAARQEVARAAPPLRERLR